MAGRGSRRARQRRLSRTLTGPDGAYTIAGLPPMTGSVVSTRSGYMSDSARRHDSGHTQLNIYIVRIPRYVLSGTVFKVGPAGDLPFEGVGIYCDGCGENGHTGVTTDANGFYSFQWVYAGNHELQLLLSGYWDPNARGPFGFTAVTVSGDTQFNLRLVPR